jgi:TolA-binding protein
MIDNIIKVRYVHIIFYIVLLSYSNTLAQQNTKKVVASKTVEDAHYEFLKELHTEESKNSGKILGRLGLASKSLSEYKRKEYNLYLDSYFPDASSDRVQMFLFELNIQEEEWAEAEMNMLKFVYLFPQSDIYKKVIDRGYTLLQEEKYYSSNRDKLIKLISDAPKSGTIYKRYHQLLSEVYELKDKKLTDLFIQESWNFLYLYPNRSQCSAVMMWLAKLEQEESNFHPAVMVYEKLMNLYPASKDYSDALYQVARLQQEEFNEYNEATVSFRKFLKMFPKHKYVAYAQYRIATMADKNFDDWSTAVKEYEVLADNYPNFKHTIASLLRMGAIQESKLKERKEAIQTYQRVFSTYPDSTDESIEALHRSANLYVKSKQFEDAVKQHMTVISTYPKTDGSLKSINKCADIYDKKMDNKEKAIEVLNMVITDYSGSRDAKKAQRRIKKLSK